MGFVSRMAAEALDTAALKLHTRGTEVAGKVGGFVGDVVANATLSPLRNRIDEDCTNCAKGLCKKY
ncbi:hypothetical protein ACIP9H_33920 [Streptomyces sp. NPDC088732]|uniref:hypothetical protein n=1 Tax=Streptomyces sp. NPDC088732 TaxID=3365879 RepID=UPI0037FD8080